MRVSAWSQHLDAEHARLLGVEPAGSLDALLEQSNFVSVHLVLSDCTRDLIGARELRRMRPTAYLINTSRGPIVNTAGLVQALSEGRSRAPVSTSSTRSRFRWTTRSARCPTSWRRRTSAT